MQLKNPSLEQMRNKAIFRGFYENSTWCAVFLGNRPVYGDTFFLWRKPSVNVEFNAVNIRSTFPEELNLPNFHIVPRDASSILLQQYRPPPAPRPLPLDPLPEDAESVFQADDDDGVSIRRIHLLGGVFLEASFNGEEIDCVPGTVTFGIEENDPRMRGQLGCQAALLSPQVSISSTLGGSGLGGVTVRLSDFNDLYSLIAYRASHRRKDDGSQAPCTHDPPTLDAESASPDEAPTSPNTEAGTDQGDGTQSNGSGHWTVVPSSPSFPTI